MKRLIAHTSIKFNEEYQPYLGGFNEKGRTLLDYNDEYKKVTMLILSQLLIMPTNENQYYIMQYLKQYDINDIKENIEMYVDEVKDWLIDRGIIVLY